jgi:hypothetical protein
MNNRSEMAEQIKEELTLREQRVLEKSIAEALSPMHEPQAQFVEELEQDLILEAERQLAKQRLLRTLGIVGGGVLTVVAGVVGFVLLRRQQQDKVSESGLEDAEVVESATPEPMLLSVG